MRKLPRFMSAVCVSVFSAVGFANIDSELPVEIQSNDVTFDDKEGTVFYTGNVIVTQGTRKLKADTLLLERDKNNKVKIMIAKGKPAKFSNHPDPSKPEGKGHADIIEYYPQQEKVDLFNNAEIFQQEDKIKGPKLTYNFVNEQLTAYSNENTRATVILQPKVEE